MLYLRDEVAGSAQQRSGHLPSALTSPVLPEESSAGRHHSLYGHLLTFGDSLQLFPLWSSPQRDLNYDSNDCPSDAHHRGGLTLARVERGYDGGLLVN